MPHCPPNARAIARRRGFTLVELLVVIGIVVLLAALLLPALTRSLQSARRTRVAAELSGIATALDAYKQDFGDYPRFATGSQAAADPLNSTGDRGARLLARAMVGPAPATDPNFTTAPGAATYFDDSRAFFQDGHGDAGDPFGFKTDREVITRGGASAVTFPGKVYSPYLDPSKFKVREDATWSAGYRYGPDAVLLDAQYGLPILYYPARIKSPEIASGTGFVAPSAPAAIPTSLYNSADNSGLLPQTGGSGLAKLLGDANENGRIDAGETAATQGPFLLIASGSGNPIAGEGYLQNPVANFTPAP